MLLYLCSSGEVCHFNLSRLLNSSQPSDDIIGVVLISVSLLGDSDADSIRSDIGA